MMQIERDIRYIYGELAKGETKIYVSTTDWGRVPLDYREALDMALVRLKELEQEKEDAPESDRWFSATGT